MREERNHNKFDNYIREELEQLTPSIKTGSWDQLLDRLDAAEQADVFDHQANIQLRTMHVPYKSSSWEVLAERLSLERDRLQAVMHYKAMEVSLFILLLITFWQYVPIHKSPTPASYPASFPIANMLPSTDLKSTEKDAFLIDTDKAFTLEEERPEETKVALHTTEVLSTEANTMHAPLTDEYAATTVAPHLNQQRNAHIALAPLPNTDVTQLGVEKDAHAQLIEYQAAKTTNLSSPTDDFRQDGALANLNGKAIALLDYGKAEDLLGYIRQTDRKTFFRIGFFGSPDFNHVITPLQRLDNGENASFNTYSLGYSGGFTLGMERSKWELELGAIYEARSYQAVPTVYISGNVAEGYTALSLKDIELNTMNLPVRARYNFIMNDKWRVYALAGASLNVVLSANYYIVEPELPSTRFTGTSNGTSRADKPYRLNNKNLTEGLLEGGSLWDNATPYANAGIGAERYMSYKWSVFAQPTFQLALPFFNKGLGPYNDRINSLGVNIGMKVRL